MDRTLFPEIFALTVFIVGFGPLARRVGSHANLWFLGWGLFLLYLLVQLFDAPHRLFTHLLTQWALLSAGLVFLLAAGNIAKRRINWWLVVEIALPCTLLAVFDIYQMTRVIPLIATCLLFVSPAVHLFTGGRQRTMPVMYICVSFAIFGVAMVPVVLHSVHVVEQISLTLVYLSTAYLYYISSDHHSQAVIASSAGFAAWALICPLSLTITHFFPTIVIDRLFLDLPVYFVVVGIMLTLLEEHVERTERLAMHDPLTDLPNRRMFEERLIATMEEARINRTTVACLVIDVDNFKMINDTLGHEAGDQLLRALAVRLSWHMTPRDILARTGGDEFTALLAGVTDEHHLRFIAGAMMSAGSVPIIIDGKPVDLHISIGIALSPDHADDIDSLRRAADQAMYTAKRRGGSMLAFADED